MQRILLAVVILFVVLQEHKGPVFADPYERLPKSVHFKYNGEVMKVCAQSQMTIFSRTSSYVLIKLTGVVNIGIQAKIW